MKTVRQVMSTNVIWVSPTHTVKSAVLWMKGHDISALPVVHEGVAVVGMVTYLSLLGENPDNAIVDVMEKAFVTIPPDTTIHEAAEIMVRDNADHLLVVHEGRMEGIVSHSDLLPELGKSFDPLTGLPWSDSLRDWSIEALKSGTEISVTLMDLDQFGAFNKKYGHVTGDLVIKTVSEVLKAGVDPQIDFLCRYAGDEFAIGSSRSIADAEELARSLTQRIAQIELGDVPEGITCSFGVFGGRRSKERLDVHYAATLDDLINHASKNCTLAKPHRPEAQDAALPAAHEAEGLTPVPLSADRENRLKINSINFNSSGALATVEVQLGYDGSVYAYSVSGYSVGRSALRLVAEATAGAVGKSLTGGYGVVLDEILTYGLGEDQQLITVIAVFITPKASIQCIGTAAVKRGDAYRAAAAALLAAINRHLAAAPRVRPQTEEIPAEE